MPNSDTIYCILNLTQYFLAFYEAGENLSNEEYFILHTHTYTHNHNELATNICDVAVIHKTKQLETTTQV